MRRISFAALLGLALAVASVAPAFAGFGGSWGPKINVWGTLNKASHAEIDGSLNVPDGSHGLTSIVLLGSKDGYNWQPTGKTFSLNVVKGQTSYGFKFDIDTDPHHFSFYKVGGYGTESRKFNRDECGYRVPEAPATPLLLLGALPAAGFIAIKTLKVRLPIPHFSRIG